MPLVVTGSIGLDTVYTPDGEHREDLLGGSCIYFAAAASFFGPVRIVGAVGEDFPPQHRGMLSRFKQIDVQGLETREGSKTFRWGGRYMEQMDQRETLFTELGVLEEMPPPIPEAYRDSKYIFLANTHPAGQLDMLANFPSHALAVADTMDLWINTAGDELKTLLERIDGLVLNYDEAELLTGARNSVTAARRILDMGPMFVVVKKGEHGCVLVHRDGIAALPAYPSERVVDPTGAGDSFAGGMMGYLARTDDDPKSFEAVRRSLAHGTIMASFNIESFSLDRLAALSHQELDARFDDFSRMLRL